MLTIQDVKDALDNVIAGHRAGGLYAPLMRQMSIYIDDAVPKKMADRMSQMGSPMCTDGQSIAINTKNLVDTINEARDYFERHNEGRGIYRSFQDEVNNIFIHELTHALCMHAAQGMKVFNERYQKSHRKTLGKELACWNIACEIEANRGYGINKYRSAVYEYAVTEEAYPKTKSAKYLLDIFQRVLADYQDQVEEDMKAIREAVQKYAGEKGEQTQKEEGQQNAKGEDKSSGEGQPQSTSEGDGEGQPQSAGEGDGEGESKSQLKLGDNPVSQARREALKKMIDETMKDSKEENIDVYNPNAERNHEEVFDEQGAAFHHGGDGVDATFDPEKDNPYEVARKFHTEWKAQNVNKALLRLKGTVVGRVSKNRIDTYSRQARRDSADGLLYKGHKRERTSSPRILLALDKSGSMSHTSTQRAVEAVAQIFENTGRPTSGCWICLHDGDVRMVRPLKQWKEVASRFNPNGGNDFSKVIALANKLDVDVVLNVGDAGDNTTWDKGAARAFEKAGRKWYDINIIDFGDDGGTVSSCRYSWKEIYTRDSKEGGVRREFIDLTGNTDISEELAKIFAK